jgi:hypothetical protein
LDLNPDDVIAFQELGSTISVGINTIADYEKYYITSSTPSFGETFIPSIVGTIDDAIASNSRGSSLSQETVNYLTIVNAGIGVTGYKKYQPLISSSAIYLGETFIPKINITNASINAQVLNKLYINNSVLTAPLYRVMKNKILNIYYNYGYRMQTWYTNDGLKGFYKDNRMPSVDLILNLPDFRSSVNPQTGGVIAPSLSVPSGVPWTFEGAAKKKLVDGVWISENWNRLQLVNGTIGPLNNVKDWDVWTSDGHKFLKQHGADWGRDIGAVGRFGRLYIKWFITKKSTEQDWTPFRIFNRGITIGAGDDQNYVKSFLRSQTLSGTGAGAEINTYVDQEYDYVWNYTPTKNEPFGTRDQWTPRKTYFLPVTYSGIKYLITEVPQQTFLVSGTQRTYSKVWLYRLDNNNNVTTRTQVGLWAPNDLHIPPETPGTPFYSAWLADVPSHGGNYGYGLLPKTLLNANETELKQLVFKFKQFDTNIDSKRVERGGFGIAVDTQSSSAAVTSGFGFNDLVADGRGSSYTVDVGQTQLRAYDYTGQALSLFANDDSYKFYDFWGNPNTINQYSYYFDRKKIFPYQLTIKANWSNGQTTTEYLSRSFTEYGDFGLSIVNGKVGRDTQPETYVERRTAQIDIPLGLTGAISAGSQSLNINNFDNISGVGGIRANNIFSSTSVTLVSAATLQSIYESNTKGNTQSSSATSEGYFADLDSSAGRILTTSYRFGVGDVATTQIAVNNTTPKGELQIQNPSLLPKVFDRTTFIQNLYLGNQTTLDLNRNFGFTLLSNEVRTIGGNYSSLSFLNTEIPSTLDKWSISLDYNSITEPSSQNIYTDTTDTRGFSGPASHNVVFRFNSSGQCLTNTIDGITGSGQIIARQAEEKIVPVYQKFGITSLAENFWKSGFVINVPAFDQNLLTETNAIPDYPPYLPSRTKLITNASFVGNGLEPLNPVANVPDEGHLYTLSFNSGATVISAYTEGDLTNQSNKEIRSLQLSSYFGLLGTTIISPDSILSSFNITDQKIEQLGYFFPEDFYVQGITGTSLNLTYQWGTESKYTEYSDAYSINSGGETISILDNLTPASSVLSSFVRPDRQRLFSSQPSGTTEMYITTVRSNPAGYTFTELRFPVRAYGGGAVRYKIYNSEEKIEFGSQIQEIFDINNNSIVRTAPITFKKSKNQPISSKFMNVGITYTSSGDELRSISLSKTPTSSAFVNNFLVIKDTSTTYKDAGSMYLFVTPDELELTGPIIPSGVNDIFYMPEYLGTTLGSKTGIPTFGPTLHNLSNWATNSAGDYIITDNLAGATAAINTSESNTFQPLVGISGANSRQAAGFSAKTYEYNYFEVTTSGATGNKLYAVPFNWNQNSDGSFNIAYANNYITLNYGIINSLARWAPEQNSSYYPIITSQPLYTDITIDLTRYINIIYPPGGPTTYTVESVDLYASNNNRILTKFTNVSGNTYTTTLTTLQDTTIYGDLMNFYTIAGTINSSYVQNGITIASSQGVIPYTTRRFYVEDGLEIINGPAFMGATYTQNSNLLTQNSLTFNLSLGGAIKYNGITLTSGTEEYFAIVLDGLPEKEFNFDLANPTTVPVNFLQSGTTYGVNLRYYPYANDPDTRLHDLSEVKPTGFSFRTPYGSDLTANTSIIAQLVNDRIYDAFINNVKLTAIDINGTRTEKDISTIDLVFETESPSVKIYYGASSTYKTSTIPAGFSQPISLQLKQLERGKYYYPYIYLEDGGYYSNLIKVPDFQVRIRPDITATVSSGAIPYKKLLTLNNLDIYDSFLVGDYSTPSNDYGYLRVVADSTNTGSFSGPIRNYASFNLADYPTRQYPSSGVTLLIDRALPSLAGYTLSNLRAYYSPYTPYDDDFSPLLTIAADSTGKVPHEFGDFTKTENLKTLFSTVTGVTLSSLPLDDDCILYGDTVLCAYSGVGSTGLLSVDFLVNDTGLIRLVDAFYGIDPSITFYDQSGFYTGTQPIVTSTDRIDLFGNTGYNQYLDSSSVPNTVFNSLPGSCTLTYAAGGVYQNTFYSFDTSVISLKPGDKVINIHYLRNTTTSLTDYIGLKVNYTPYECIYNGNVLEVSNPDDLTRKICVFRGDFPNQRDVNNTPHPDLDYMFTVFKHFKDDLGYKFYFQTKTQVDSWNASPVSDYWWTANRAKPLLTCPFKILNRYIELVRIPPVFIPPTPLSIEVMDGIITTSPAIFYGSVTVTGFNYYKSDSVNASYLKIFNPTRLTLKQFGGTTVYARAIIDSTQPNYQDITFIVGSTMLSPNTTYKMMLLFEYNSGQGYVQGTSNKQFDYITPPDESNFDNLRSLVGIHKLRAHTGNSKFGNLPLNNINKQEQLTLYAKTNFNYKGDWTGASGYTLLDAVTYPDLYGTTRLYWLRNLSRYTQSFEPYFGSGWEDTTSYINFVGGYANAVNKNDVFTYSGSLYKVGNDGVGLAPDILDKNINRFIDYDTDVLVNKSFPFDAGSTIIFENLIPDISYEMYFKMAEGNSYGPREYYGNYNIATYKTLPDKLQSGGCTGTSTNVILSNVSYKNSTSSFRSGVLNYNWGVGNPRYSVDSSYSFSGVTSSFPYNSSGDAPVLDNVYVSYTPSNILNTTGMEDQTDVYRPFVSIESTCTSVDIVRPFYNLVNVSVTGYTPKDVLGAAATRRFNPSPDDSFIILKNGVFWQTVPLTNATFDYRTYDSNGVLLQTADISLAFSITGLTDKTTYSDFSIRYKVQGTNSITGSDHFVPVFTTTPKLVIVGDAILSATRAIFAINRITYCDVLYSTGQSMFPYANTKNKIIITFQASESVTTRKIYQTDPVTVSSTTLLPKTMRATFPPASSNTGNYTFNQIKIEYTAANVNGVLETIQILSSGNLNLTAGENLNLIA